MFLHYPYLIKFKFGLSILKIDPYCLYQIMADNSSETKKDSTPQSGGLCQATFSEQ